MALRLTGQTSGYVELEAPAVAGSNTLTLPDGNGAANQVLKNSATAGTLEYGLTLPTGNGTAHQVLKNSATPGTLEYGVTLPSGNGTAHQVLKNSATAGTLEYGLALPTGNGTSGQYLQTDGAGGSSWAGAGKILQVISATTGAVNISSTSYVDTGSEVTITPSSSSNKVLVLATFTLGMYDTADGLATQNYGSGALFRDSTELHAVAPFLYLLSTTQPQLYWPSAINYLDSPATTSATTYKIRVRNYTDDNYVDCRRMSIIAMEVAPN